MRIIDGIILFLLSLNFFGLTLVYFKSRKIHLFCWSIKDLIKEHSAHVIKNIEALEYLNRELQLNIPLPATMGYAGSPDFLRLISEYITEGQVQNALECSSGISTLILASNFKRKGAGHVYSLEHDNDYCIKTRDTLNKYGLADWATVIHAPLKQYNFNNQDYNWYDIDGLPDIKFDCLVIDGPPGKLCDLARYPAGPMLFNKLSQNAHIFLDDYQRPDEKTVVKMWVAENPKFTLIQHPFIKGCAELYPKV